jgi:hypothetical protein
MLDVTRIQPKDLSSELDEIARAASRSAFSRACA